MTLFLLAIITAIGCYCINLKLRLAKVLREPPKIKYVVDPEYAAAYSKCLEEKYKLIRLKLDMSLAAEGHAPSSPEQGEEHR